MVRALTHTAVLLGLATPNIWKFGDSDKKRFCPVRLTRGHLRHDAA